jgi:propanediol dehydratase small subunit
MWNGRPEGRDDDRKRLAKEFSSGGGLVEVPDDG